MLPQAVLGEPQLIYWRRTSRIGHAHCGHRWSARWLHGRSHGLVCLEGDLRWIKDMDISQVWGIMSLHPYPHCFTLLTLPLSSRASPFRGEGKEVDSVWNYRHRAPDSSFPCSVRWQMLSGSCQNKNKPTIEPSLKITGKVCWAELYLAKLTVLDDSIGKVPSIDRWHQFLRVTLQYILLT